jgi:glycerol-3-phosphate dehydrogenase
LSTDLETSGRLFSKLGKSHQAFINFVDEEELTRIPGTAILWAEVRHAARFEGVVRLEDLLFRRTRIGNILPNGGMEHMDRIKSIMQTELRWNDEMWLNEMKDYRTLYNENYSLNSLE